MDKLRDIILFFLICGLFVFFQIFIDFIRYRHRGHAKPDNSKDENYPVITNPSDAFSQRIIDDSKKDS